MLMREILLPETKPALEWINGRAVQKVSPRRKHALAQMRFAAALDAWAIRHGSGVVGTEWEFRLAPAGEVRRPLVRDVAYLSYLRLPYADEASSEIPRIAPDAVVEVLSSRDRQEDVQEKIRVYIACGAPVVFLVDTRVESVIARDRNGAIEFARNGVVRHSSLAGFSMPVATLFELPPPGLQ